MTTITLPLLASISVFHNEILHFLSLNEIISSVQERRDQIFRTCKYVLNPLAFRESELSSISFADLKLLYYILSLLPNSL